MKPITFPQANCELAKDQPEYETLHVYVEHKKVKTFGNPVEGEPQNQSVQSIPWAMTACFELTEDEIAEIVRTKKIWHTQLVMGNNFQPIMMTTKNPFE
jgi:hypothetical protein